MDFLPALGLVAAGLVLAYATTPTGLSFWLWYSYWGILLGLMLKREFTS